MKVSDEELARRRANWTPKTKEVSGYLKRYAALVTSADKGAILKETKRKPYQRQIRECLTWRKPEY